MRGAIALAAFVPVWAVAQTVSCPAELPKGSIDVARTAPAGWLASSPSLIRLDGGGMLSGDPNLMQYLAPASSKKFKGGGSSAWNFEPGEEKWLYCNYGGIAVQLSKRIDDKATRCEVTATLDQVGAIKAITAVCK
jgi:hypothetical protein